MRHGRSTGLAILSIAMTICGARFACAADKWVSVQSRNLLLVGNAGESRIRRIANDLEQLRAVFAMLFLHSDMAARINFVSDVATLKDSVACGPFKPEPHVLITYQRSSDPDYLGEPLVVEFQP